MTRLGTIRVLVCIFVPMSVVTASFCRIQPGSGHHSSSYRDKKAVYHQTHSTKRSSARHCHPKYDATSGTQPHSHGKIKRSLSARHDFMKEAGRPHGKPGYVIEHLVPLSNGGADDPINI